MTDTETQAEQHSSQGFKVAVGEFEGPIDLLLTLIEKRKMHPSEVALAAVADSYLEYVKGLREMPVGDTAHFIYVASTLLLIKSRSLLPSLQVTEEEQADIRDLERRLKLFKLLKDKAPTVQQLFVGKEKIFTREEARNQVVIFHPPEELSEASLLDVIRQLIARVPKPNVLPKVVIKKVISLEEMISDLGGRIQKSLKMSFREFSGSVSKAEKVNVVVSFLAMLELVKQGTIDVKQQDAFHDIEMESLQTEVPNYS